MTFKEFRESINSAILDMGRNSPRWSFLKDKGEFEQHWEIGDSYQVSLTFILDVKDDGDDVTVKKVYDDWIYKYRLPDIKNDVGAAIDYDNENKPYLSETEKSYERSRARTTIEDTIKILDTLVNEYKLLSDGISSKNNSSVLNNASKLIDGFVNKLLQLRPKLENLLKFFNENRDKSYGGGKH